MGEIADQTKITPVILCGGTGSRLWPVSRESYPKQFARYLGGETLFERTLSRLSGPVFDDPLVITGEAYRFIVADQMGLDIRARVSNQVPRIVTEPQPRNTAPAALVAALMLEPEALMLIAPSDHQIADGAQFRADIAGGVEAAMAGRVVTFGVVPDRAETGYGYLALDDLAQDGPPFELAGFVEKPDAARAQAMLEDGRYFWNAGIFLVKAEVLIQLFETHAGEYIEPARTAVAGAQSDLVFRRLEAEAWQQIPKASLDVAIMEQADCLSMVPLSHDWTDLGDWNAVWRDAESDVDGVATTGQATAIECEDSLLSSDDAETHLVGLGLKGIVAIATGDAVLVADKSRSQDVRLAVEDLRARQIAQATENQSAQKPWGSFDILAKADRFQVKRITVKPGAALSLQSHVHRAEHWIVVSGTAKVTLGDATRLVTENESVYIPIGTRHRLENPGQLPLVLIEVQTGSYLGEDDIERFEDLYARD